MESVTKASFGLLETLRVALPGYYFSALAYVLFSLLGVELGALKEESLISLILGLAVGFVLYSLNLPNRRAVYNRKQPSEYLRQLSVKLSGEIGRPEVELDNFRAVGTYLYVLNNYFPQTFHEVVMVRGALWYCMTYFGFISIFFGVVGALLAAWSRYLCGPILKLNLECLIYVIGNLLVGALIFGSGRTDRMLQAVYKDQILWMDLNERLLRYILLEEEDPKLNRILSGNSSESDE